MQKVTPLLTVVVNKYYTNDSIPNTLSMVPDDVIQVLTIPNKVWWDGIIVDPVGNVTRGWFPANHTSILKQHTRNYSGDDGHLPSISSENDMSILSSSSTFLEHGSKNNNTNTTSPIGHSATCDYLNTRHDPLSSSPVRARGLSSIISHQLHQHGNCQPHTPHSHSPYHLQNHQPIHPSHLHVQSPHIPATTASNRNFSTQPTPPANNPHQPNLKFQKIPSSEDTSLREDSLFHSKHGSLTSGKSSSHEILSLRQHSQAMSESASGNVHLISKEEAASYFQPINPVAQPGFNFVPVWIPQCTKNDDFVYYNQALNIHSRDLPFISANYIDDTSEYEVADSQRLMNELVNPLPVQLTRGNTSTSDQSLQSNQYETDSISNMLHSSLLQSSQNLNQSNTIKLPQMVITNEHHGSFDPNQFYLDSSDNKTWSNLIDKFVVSLKETVKHLKSNDKENFRVGMNEASQYITSIHIASKLIKNEVKENKKSKKFSTVMNCLISAILDWRIAAQVYLICMEISEAQDDSSDQIDLPQYQKDLLFKTAPEHLAKSEIQVQKIEKISNLLLKLIKSLSLYNRGDPNILPIVYPRFFKHKFEGGNFKNQFFDIVRDDIFITSKSNTSNILLDDEMIQSVKKSGNHVSDQLDKIETILNRTKPSNIGVKEFVENKNLDLLTMIYHSIPILASYLKTIESIDFTVFAMIDKLASQSKAERQDTIVSNTESTPTMSTDDNTQWFYDTAAQIIRPLFIEFYQLKQGVHSSSSDIVIDAQNMTTDDPEVFFAMKLDIKDLFTSLNLNHEHCANPSIYQSAVEKYSKTIRKRLETIDKLLFNDGLYSAQPVLKLFETIKILKERMDLINISLSQLKDQRLSILNYCTRLMNSDFNIASLFIAERHNTLASTASQVDLFYPTGRKMSSDQTRRLSSAGVPIDPQNPDSQTHIPWYLDLDDDEKDLVYDFNGIRGGSSRGLIARLVDPLCERDSVFEQTILSMFISFTTPLKLFELLIEKYNLSMPETLSYEEYGIWLEKKVGPQQAKVIEIFRLLFSTYWLVQYTTPELIQLWRDFTGEMENSVFPNELIDLGFKVMSLTDQDSYYKFFELNTDSFVVLPLAPLSAEITKIKLFEMDIDSVAKQLTAMQAFYYRKINRNDLLFRSYNFNKLLKSIAKKRDSQTNRAMQGEHTYKMETKNITNFIKNCNSITQYISYMILKYKDLHERVEVVKYFITLAEKLLYLKNFSSMTAIISGLSSTSIARLKKTWELVPHTFVAKFNKMDSLMSVSKNYSEYRNILKFMETDGDPYLPFLGVFLSDLRFTTDGNSDWLTVPRTQKNHTFTINEQKVINITKRMNIVTIINQILSFNNVKYNFPLCDKMTCYFMTIFESLPDNEALYEMSLNIEPKVNIAKNSSIGESGNSNINNSLGSSVSSLPPINKRGSSVGSVPTSGISSSSWLFSENPALPSKRKIRNYRELLSMSNMDKEEDSNSINNANNSNNNNNNTFTNLPGPIGMSRMNSGVSLMTTLTTDGSESRSGSLAMKGFGSSQLNDNTVENKKTPKKTDGKEQRNKSSKMNKFTARAVI